MFVLIFCKIMNVMKTLIKYDNFRMLIMMLSNKIGWLFPGEDNKS